MKFISEAETAAVAAHDMAYDAIREALIAVVEQGSTSFPVVIAHGSAPENIFSIKSASTSSLAGLKVGSFWPGNLDRGLARHNSTIFLVDQENGRIEAAVEAGKLNAYRTAAADAVAADALARTDARTLAIFGAGHQARYECAALARIRPIETIFVVARRPEQAQAMIADLAPLGVSVIAASPQSACEAADIIVTATLARAPLFDADWVRLGTHIASMGSDSKGKQELPPALFGGARLFCDYPRQARDIGEFQHAGPSAELVAIGDVLTGQRAGRTSTLDVTIFDSSGLSIQDLYIAQKVLDTLGK
jgi:ornithine cyclodeaminase